MRKNQMDFKSNVRIGGAKLNKQKIYLKNITNLYDAPHEVIKIYKDCLQEYIMLGIMQ